MSTRWDRLGAHLLATCMTAALLANTAVTAPAESVHVTLLENSPARITILYEIDDVVQTPVRIGNDAYTRVSLPGEPLLKTRGAPELPHHTDSVIIPDDAAMAVRVTESQFYEFCDIDVAPSKGFIPRSVDPADVPYTFGDEYARDAFFPSDPVTLGRPYILRDYRGAVIDIQPLQYNPVSRTLRVYSALKVEIVPVDQGRINVLGELPATQQPSRSFDTLYRRHFLNYTPTLRYPPLNESGDMLIIAHNAWIPNVQPLVDHKNSLGINTTLVGVNAIGNDPTSIKTYIQSVYDAGGLAFVLLVGDAEQVVPSSAVGGASDPRYTQLTGDDDYPDILIGRFSAETAADVDTQVLRTIEYEAGLATLQPWFWQGMGVASNLGVGDDGEYDNEHIDYIRDDLLAHGYTAVDQIYDPDGTVEMISNGLNAGRGIVNYCGHGTLLSWCSPGYTIAHVNQLTNDNMLPFVFSVACSNGQFDGGTCFAETWMRATNGNEPAGAIAFYGSSISQPWDPPMEAQDEFNLLYCAESYVMFGALCYAGACSMMDDYQGDGETWGTGPATFNTWHVFGDPSLRVVGTPPMGLDVSPSIGLTAEGEVGGPFSPDSITYTLTNLGETPIDYEVTASAAWISVSSTTGTLPVTGTMPVTVSINTRANGFGSGVYTERVSFINTTNHEGDTTRLVHLKVGHPTLQYQWDLDTDPGWPMEGEWDWGQPTGGGGLSWGYPDPTGGATGTTVCGVNLDGDYPVVEGGPYHTTLGPVDLSDIVGSRLRFQRWLNTDYQPFASATIEASSDGINWTVVWQNGTSDGIMENAWSTQEYDLSSVADDQPAVYVRWGYAIGSGAWAYSGWNIDDVELWGLVVSQAPLPGDLDCDGDVDFDDINPFVLALGGQDVYHAAYPDCNWLNGDCNGDGDVNFDDINAFVALLGA